MIIVLLAAVGVFIKQRMTNTPAWYRDIDRLDAQSKNNIPMVVTGQG